MLSEKSVQVAASNFVAVKIDPAKSRDAMQHKTTRYVPELVVLDPAQNFVTSLTSRDAPSLTAELNEALARANRR